MCQGQEFAIWGMVIPPLIGNPYNGYINPYYWVDDYPLHGNDGNLEPITQEIFATYPPRYDVEFYDSRTIRFATKNACDIARWQSNLPNCKKHTQKKKQHQSGANIRGNSPKSNWIIWGWAWQVDQVSCKPPKACWGHWGWEKNSGTHSGSWRLIKDAY